MLKKEKKWVYGSKFKVISGFFEGQCGFLEDYNFSDKKEDIYSVELECGKCEYFNKEELELI